MTIRTLNLLVEILAAHHLEAVAVDKFIGIEESALVEVESVDVERYALCHICKSLK